VTVALNRAIRPKRALNGIYNRANEGAQARPADPEFDPLLQAILRIQRTGSLGVRIEKQRGEELTLMSFPARPTPELQSDIQFVFDTLRLKPDKGEVTLSFGATQRTPNDIAVLSRSMVEILVHIAAGIEVPAQDVANGRTFASLEVPQAPTAQDRPIVAIHSGKDQPSGAYAAVQYRGTWYFIDDHDFAAKRAFTFLMLFFSLAETGVPGQAPVLTIPAN
jgi:hypothetical protein